MVDKEKIDIREIPIIPQVATKILQMQEENLQISFKELENLILLDPALTAKILKVANSALYARQREITNLQQAITLLGFKTIKSLVMLVCASNLYGKKKGPRAQANINTITKVSELSMWRHSVLTAFVGRAIATRLKMEDRKEEVFIAGLLHDIGRIVLMINFPDGYDEFLNTISTGKGINILSIEENIFGMNHQDVGKDVLNQWNFPEELIDTAYFHHTLHVDSKYKNMVSVVGLANIYAKIIAGENITENDQYLQDGYMKSLNIDPDLDKYLRENFLREIEKDDLYLLSSSMFE